MRFAHLSKLMQKHAFNKPLEQTEGKERRKRVIPEGRVFKEGVNFSAVWGNSLSAFNHRDRTVGHLARA
ncbi:hypothetical protein [Nostoc sp.]|uniref:hypothetical protein n=1 Tax=Nostoc sp. TaxID=1180 RepID=UPI002FF54A12